MVDVSFTMIMQWFNFGILLFLLHRFLFKPLLAFLDKRSQEIEAEINEAENNKAKSAEVLSGYEQKLKDIQIEADKIIDAARKEAEKEKTRIIEAAQTESKNIILAAQEDIKSEVNKAKAELSAEVSSLVISCASKVLEREVNDHDHKKFIESFLQESE